MSYQEEALRFTQDTLERLYFWSAGVGTLRCPLRRASGRGWGGGISGTLLRLLPFPHR